MKRLADWLRRRFLPREDWRAEIEAHLAMREEWNQRAKGLPEEEARAEARRKFGSATKALEGVRDVYWARWIDDGAQDVRHAVRDWRRNPGLFFTIIGTMTLGIGAATAIFSLVDPLLFRPLPYPHGERLVSLGISGPIDMREFVFGGWYLDWRDQQKVFSSLTAMRPGGECDVNLNRAVRIACVSVEWNFLRTLEVHPEAGRDFQKEEDIPGAPLTALISHRFAYGSGAQLKPGEFIEVDGQKARIAGVLPATFVMPQRGEADVLLPAQLNETAMRSPGSTVFLRAFGRLKPEISVARAREAMGPLFRHAMQQAPSSLRRELGLVVRSLRDRQIEEAKAASWLLLLAVLFLLAMSSVNVINLLLARAEARKEETAMRLALGASYGRLLRQSFTESILYGSLGATFGIACAYLLLHGLRMMAAGGFLRLESVHVDRRVMLAAATISLLCSAIVGTVPTLRLLRPELLRTWRNATARRSRLRQMLLSLQIAFSLILLSGSLLFMRSLLNLQAVATGFAPTNLIAVTLNAMPARYPRQEQLAAFHNELERRFSLLPQTDALAMSDSLPPAGGMHGRPLANMVVDGVHETLQGNTGMVAFRYVTPTYFEAMRIRVLAGTVFSEEQRVGKESAMVISESLAKRLFGRGNPLGRRINLGEDLLTVVAVVADVKNNGLDAAAWPEYYRVRMRDGKQLGHGATAIFRTTLSAAAVERWATKQVAAIDPTVPIKVTALPQKLRALNDRPRFLAMMMTTLALAALSLVAVGLYGVVSFLAASRRRELGLRAALGATRRNLALLMQKDILIWVLFGAALGLGGEMAAQRYLRSLLFGVSAGNPVTLGLAVISLLLVAVAASWRPVSRAAKVDPAVTLRVE